MAEDVYAVPDLTKKVRYRRERERETEDRGEREERVVDIYVSADELDPGPDPDPGTQQVAVQQNTTQQQQRGASDESKNSRSRVIAVCLGLLCVILLAGIIIVLVKNNEEKNNLANTTEQKVQIQSSYDLLQSKYDNLTKDLAQIQSRHTIVTEQKVQIQSSFDNLQTKYDNLTKHLNQILSSYNDVTAERDELNKKRCEPCGWQTFGRGCYYISTEGKTWEQSRKYCTDRLSDLIIINSKEEQDFVTIAVNWGQEVWLGLTDRKKEGVWKWVDGTPERGSYWRDGEPNGYYGEDCAVSVIGRWEDRSCGNRYRWICQRVF